MFRKNYIAFLLVFLILIITMGAVSADDNATPHQTFDNVTKLIENAQEDSEITLDGEYVSEGSEIEVTKNLNFIGKNNAVLDGNEKSSIISSQKNLVFKDITFKNAFSNKKHAIQAYNLTFINCTFINNKIGMKTSNIDADEMSAINCTFKNNEADRIITTIGIILENSKFENNNAEYIVDADHGQFISSKFINNTNAFAIYMDSAFISDCEFISNKVGINTYSYTGHFNIGNSRFNKNRYGIYIDTFYAELKLDNCSFAENSNIAVYTLSSTEVTNTNFTSNRYAFKSYTSAEEPYEIPVANKANFTNCLFKSNTGGAIVTDNTMTIKNTVFDANKGTMAGAIFSRNKDRGNTITITDSTFTNNNADYAGAIKTEGSVVKISTTTFENNTPASIIATSVNAYTMEDENYKVMGKITLNSKTYTRSVNLNDELKPITIAKVTTKPITTSYYSGAKLNIKLVNTLTKQPIKYSVITIKAFTGKKYKYYEVRTNKNGIASFSASVLNAGPHKIEITSDFGVCNIPKTTTAAKIIKAKTITKAPKVVGKYKKSKLFKVSVKNKASKKAAKYVVLNLKIGKKVYKIKTNAKGIAKFNIKNVGYGKHSVAITSANTNYIVSARSTITIR